jgi:hypothetical protein
MKTYNRYRFLPRNSQQPLATILSSLPAFIEPFKLRGKVFWRSCAERGSALRGETPFTPDVLDAGYTPQGLAVTERRRVRRVRRVEVLFYFLCPGVSHIRLSILAAISSFIQVAKKGFLGFLWFFSVAENYFS